MNPFDDTSPEEQKSEHRELIELLQRVRRNPLSSASAEQEQIIARVKQRLASVEYPAMQLENNDLPLEDIIIQSEANEMEQAGTVRSSPLSPANFPKAIHPRGRRSTRIFNALAALLVVGLLISGSLALFRRSAQTSTNGPLPAMGPAGTFVTVYGESGGLAMSLSITRGPYFLSEMLAVDISLTDYTQKMYYLGAPFVESGCGYWAGVMVTGGARPDYEIPIATGHSCPLGAGRTLPLESGATLTSHAYLPLTQSGKQTLTGSIGLFSTDQTGLFHQVADQFSWPSIQINVSPTILANHKLSFKIEGSHVVVTAPTSIPSHLVYLYGVGCEDFNNDGGSTGTGNYGWEPISTNMVSEPGCPGKNVQWYFAFGTPGYAVVTGRYPPS